MFLIPQSANSSSILLKRDGGEPMLGFGATQLFWLFSGVSSGWAKAGIALATIVAAIRVATDNTISMRLMRYLLLFI